MLGLLVIPAQKLCVASCTQVQPSNLSNVPLRAPIKGSAAFAEMQAQQLLAKPARPSVVTTDAHLHGRSSRSYSPLSAIAGFFGRRTPTSPFGRSTPPPPFTPIKRRVSMWRWPSRRAPTSHLAPVNAYSPAMPSPPQYGKSSSDSSGAAIPDETEKPEKLFCGCL